MQQLKLLFVLIMAIALNSANVCRARPYTAFEWCYFFFHVFLPFLASLKWFMLLTWLLVLGRLQLWKNHQRVIICARVRKSKRIKLLFSHFDWLLSFALAIKNDFSWRTQLRWISICSQRDAAQSSNEWMALASGKHTQDTGTAPHYHSMAKEKFVKFFGDLLGFFASNGISIFRPHKQAITAFIAISVLREGLSSQPPIRWFFFFFFTWNKNNRNKITTNHLYTNGNSYIYKYGSSRVSFE